MMFGHGGNGWGVGGWIVMAILMVILWGALVSVVVSIFYRGISLGRQAASSVTSDASAKLILAERFARGDIDEGEYRTRRASLGNAK